MADGDSLGSAVLELDVDLDKYSKGIDTADKQAKGLSDSTVKSAKQAGDSFDDAGSKAQGFGTKLGGVAQIAGGFILAQGITAAGGYLLDAAKGAAADEQATARLDQTLVNLGGDFDSHKAKVNDAISAGEKLAFTDDEVRDSFQTLAVATGSVEEGLNRQKLAFDLARGAGIPLATATKMVSKVNEESVDGFRKLGIVIADGATEADALAAVQAKYAGQSEAYAKGTAGQFEIAQIKMAEAQETIGGAILPAMTGLATVASVVLPVAFGLLATAIGGIVTGIGFLTTHAQTLMPLFIAITAVIGIGLVVALAVAIPLVWGYATAWLAAAVAIIAANLPLIAIIAVIMLVVAGIVLLVQHWDTIVEKVPALGVAVDAVKVAFQAFLDFLTGTFVPGSTAAFDAVVGGVQAAVEFIKQHWATILPFIQPLLDQLKAYFELIWGAIQAYIDMVMSTIQGIIDVVMGLITGDWERAWSGVKQIFEAQMEFIKTLGQLGMQFLADTITNILTNVIQPLWELTWEAIKALAGRVWDEIVASVQNALNTIEGKISAALSTISGWWDAAMQKIYDVRDTFYALRDGIIDAISGALSWIGNLIDKINSIPSPGDVVSGIGGALGFATGTSDYPGGYGIVGEKGPELVALPKHSQIHPANETRSLIRGMMSRDGQGDGASVGGQVGVNFYGPVSILARNTEEATQGASNFGWGIMASARARGFK